MHIRLHAGKAKANTECLRLVRSGNGHQHQELAPLLQGQAPLLQEQAPLLQEQAPILQEQVPMEAPAAHRLLQVGLQMTTITQRMGINPMETEHHTMERTQSR